jgi:glycosyltransferase involved in cell wall biosynthesis
MPHDLAIILCTYNGEAFLKEQLESFQSQTYKNWHLFVYDDGSTDSTKVLVEGQKQAYNEPNKINFISNHTKRGFAKNFLYGLLSTPPDFSLYAFSDQDDVWLKNKLEKAVSYFMKLDNDRPALYCSRTILTNSKGEQIGLSPLFKLPPSFSNSLVQSIAGGNTMVFNKAARDIIAKAKLNDLDIVSHDWFIYQLISGAGGEVYYDSTPEILYRQHGNNLIGSNTGLLAKIFRIKQLLKGSFKDWNDKNIQVLSTNADLLTKDNQIKLKDFDRARKSWFIPRIIGLIKCGIYRQTIFGNLGLVVAALLKRI